MGKRGRKRARMALAVMEAVAAAIRTEPGKVKVTVKKEPKRRGRHIGRR